MFHPVYPAKPRKYRKRAMVVPGSQSVNVVSVTLIDNTGAIWTFDGPVTITENQPCPQLKIQTSSGWQGASNIGGGDEPNQIACDYESGDLEVGQSYLIDATPVNVVFESGSLSLPQSGVIE